MRRQSVSRRNIKSLLPYTLVVLVVALVERWTRDRKVAGSTPGRGAINLQVN